MRFLFKRFVAPGLLFFSLGLLFSCSTGYQLLETKRTKYAVDQNLVVDSSIIHTYLPYKKELDREMNQVLGHTEVALIKKNDEPESLLSNFFADAIRSQALKQDPTIDFAMPSTKGGIRVDLPKGEIKLSNLFELMPFENELIIFTLKGRDVQELLNFIAASNGQPVSGLRLKIVDKKPIDVLINGKSFNPMQNYRVLTSDYIAGGGDNAAGFKNPVEKKVLGIKVRDALINYVKENHAAGKTINPKLDGRITKS